MIKAKYAKIDKVLLLLGFTIFIIFSCDSFQQEDYKIDPIDGIGSSALQGADSTKIFPATVRMLNDTLLVRYENFPRDTILGNGELYDSLDSKGIKIDNVKYKYVRSYDIQNALVVSFKDDNDNLLFIDTTFFDDENVVIDSAKYDTTFYDNNGNEINSTTNYSEKRFVFEVSSDTVLLNMVDSFVNSLPSALPEVDSIFTSKPAPSYEIQWQNKSLPNVVIFKPEQQGKFYFFINDFIEIKVLDTVTNDTLTFISDNIIPYEISGNIYNTSPNENPEPIVKTRYSYQIDGNKDLIIMFLHKQQTSSSNSFRISIATE